MHAATTLVLSASLLAAAGCLGGGAPAGSNPTPETTVETDCADHGPLCVKLPPDRLVAGMYSVMAHSKVALDAQLTFSVATLGGGGRLVDEPHMAPASETVAYLPELLI